ncbi:MAG: fluoride efflux transporter FluC [Salibacteraceae bacterium]
MAELKLLIPVFIGGGLGSILRFSISVLVVNNLKGFLPIATLVANLLAILIMGITLFYAEAKIEAFPWVRAFVLIGFCGGLSTFSTFSFETVLLLKGYHWGYALANVLVSVTLGTLVIYPFVKMLK